MPGLTKALASGFGFYATLSELASWFIDIPILAVTGTDGKSTTTSLCGELLKSCGLSVFVGGNLGTPLSELPLSGEKYDVAVVELSSFQLEAVQDFHPAACAVTNLSFDHQDRYPSFEHYISAKSNVFNNFGEGDTAVLNAKDAASIRHFGKLPSRIHWFGDPTKPGAFIEGDTMHLRTEKHNLSFDLKGFQLAGAHNRENLMAATLLALTQAADAKGIAKGIEAFTGLPHRLEKVLEIDGVLFVNDSKATSVSATATALKAMDRPIILLMGGGDKGGDFASLKDLISSKVKMLITFGEAAQKIEAALGDATKLVGAGPMENAVKLAKENAAGGDVVALSPGCASFDAYKNFEDRGNRFKEVVYALR